MRALLQRVSHASVTTKEKQLGKINKGLLILLGVTHGDTQTDIDFLVEKLANLRIFEDAEGKMNLSALDIKAEILIISQFTLYADTKKGRRPAFTDAAAPAYADELYKKFIQKFGATGLKIQEGEFGAHMFVELVNDGPVTIMVESSAKNPVQ